MKSGAAYEIIGPVNAPKFEVSVDASIDENNYIRISTKVPDIEEAPPVDICCVIDISESMA